MNFLWLAGVLEKMKRFSPIFTDFPMDCLAQSILPIREEKSRLIGYQIQNKQQIGSRG